MEQVILILAVVCYILSSAGFIASEYKQARAASRVAFIFAVLGVLLHFYYMFLRVLAIERLSLFGSKDAISFFTLLFVLLFVLFRMRYRRVLMGMFIMPIATVFMMCSLFVPEHFIPVNPSLKSGWILFHLVTLFVAYAFFAVAFCASIMYVLQEKMIKKKSINRFVARMPSLESLDKVNHLCIIVGFPFMTAGLFAGFGAAKFFWHKSWSGDPKEIFSLLTWIVYAVLFHERLAVGWRGRKASWFAICGFLCVVVTFLGVNLLMRGHHTTFVGR